MAVDEPHFAEALSTILDRIAAAVAVVGGLLSLTIAVTVLLTLPVFFPIIYALDFGFAPDEVAVWFGILVLIGAGIGLTAPPIGLDVFVIRAIAKDVPITQTYRGVLPFIATDIVRLVLVASFPALALGPVRRLSQVERWPNS